MMKLNSLKILIIFVLLFGFNSVGAVEHGSCFMIYGGAAWKFSLISDDYLIKPGEIVTARMELTAPMSEMFDLTFSVGFGTNLVQPYPWYPMGFATEAAIEKKISAPSTSGFYNFEVWGDSGDGTGYTKNCVSSIEVAEPITLPPRVYLSGDKSTVSSGGTVKLTWESLNNYPATECTASSEPANSQWTGSQAIPINNGDKKTKDITNITQKTNFKLQCKNGAGSDTLREWTVDVSKPLPPLVTLTTDPLVYSVKKGESVNLKWNQFRTADSCTASSVPSNSQWSGNVAVEGTKTITNIQSETTFSITCTNAGGSDESSKLIKITTTIPRPPYVNLVLNPSSIKVGESTEVSWFVRRADKCVASGYPGVWEGNKTFIESDYVRETITNFKESKKLTLTCENGDGSVSDSEDLTVTSAVPPQPGEMSLSFSASPTFVEAGDDAFTELSWSTTNAKSCRISANYTYSYTSIDGEDVKKGKILVKPLLIQGYTYKWTLTCSQTNNPFTNPKQATVEVISKDKDWCPNVPGIQTSESECFLDIGLRINAGTKSEMVCTQFILFWCSNWQINVTYNNILKIAAEAGTPTSPLRINKRTSSGATKIFGIALVPPGDPKATGWIVKVKDKNGVLKPMALRKL